MKHRAARQYSDQIYCSHCRRTWDVNDAEPPPCEPYLNEGKVTTPYDKRTTALVGFLAVKLATYEPDCPTVKDALEWLRDANS